MVKADDSELENRITKVEVKMDEIQKVTSKLDQKLDLVMAKIGELQLELATSRQDLIQRQELNAYDLTTEKKFEDIESKFKAQELDRKKLKYMALTALITFGLWLLQQLINVEIRFPG